MLKCKSLAFMKPRLTKNRSAVLEVLKCGTEALSAGEIHTKLPKMDLVTIYRSLDYLAEHKLIKKLSLNSQEAKFEYQRVPHHHAVCTDCERVIHFTAPDEKIKELLGIKDFLVDELEVTVKGICKHT
jgi:Fur family peroxide stress response transcriptional regulator